MSEPQGQIDKDVEELLANMDKDFEDAINGVPQTATPVSTTPPEEPEVTEPVAAPVSAKVVDHPSSKPQSSELADKFAAATPASNTLMQEQMEALKRENEELKKKQEQAAAQPAAPASEPAAEPVYEREVSEEDEAFLNGYKKDWPDVSKAEELHRRVLTQRLGIILAQMHQHVQKELSDIRKALNIQTLSSETGGDYEGIKQQVLGWIDTQPAIMQDTYRSIIEGEDTSKIKQLLDIWKQSSSQNSASSPVSEPASQPPIEDLQAQAGVKTRRGAVPLDNTDTQDEEKAFTQAVKAMGL